MNVTEFAEQIVFGTTLEEKLARPGKLTMDAGKPPRLQHTTAPGRSAALAMHNGPGVSQPPKDSELGNEQARGRLLHFLANHELLATELMALVLLKFPDAPHAFKRGVLVTLQEEQEHTRLYMKRMQECGVEFGSFPLSGHFWRVVEPMQSPMDFVSRLSLTFEQANLDYSLHFASVFKRLGDTDTAQILQQIYEDEIGHVQHGLHWFRQWKDPQQSDWQAYQQSLQFPMSPQRGRGPACAFNREGRRRAGLTDDFIDAIEVFRQSRGRPPTVRWFNAGAEAELNGPPTTKERHLLDQLTIDLEGTMVALARQDDVQLVSRMPPIQFRKQMLEAGIDLPEFIPSEEFAQLERRKLSELSPWAWTPSSHALAGQIGTSVQSPSPRWNDSLPNLFRKSWGSSRLSNWLAHNETPESLAAGTSYLGISTIDQVQSALLEMRSEGHPYALFKADLATSGRNQRRLNCNGLTDADQQWLAALWRTHATGIMEPELERVLDISFLWQMTGHDTPPRFQGWTRPLVTAGRRYYGTRLSRPFEDCDRELKRFLLADDCGRLRATRDWLSRHLLPELHSTGFTYHFGVDAFVHRTSTGELRIHPLVELNPRLTMGHVALSLQKHIAPVVEAEFRIFTRSEWTDTAAQYASTPLVKSSDGRWRSGLVALSHVDANTKLIPAVLIRDR